MTGRKKFLFFIRLCFTVAFYIGQRPVFISFYESAGMGNVPALIDILVGIVSILGLSVVFCMGRA